MVSLPTGSCPAPHQKAAAAPRLTTPPSSRAGSGGEWVEGEVVTGVRYKLGATGEEATALAHLTVVCDGMYSGEGAPRALFGTFWPFQHDRKLTPAPAPRCRAALKAG